MFVADEFIQAMIPAGLSSLASFDIGLSVTAHENKPGSGFTVPWTKVVKNSSVEINGPKAWCAYNSGCDDESTK